MNSVTKCGKLEYTAHESRTDSLFHQVGSRADIDDLVLVGHRAETFLPRLKIELTTARWRCGVQFQGK